MSLAFFDISVVLMAALTVFAVQTFQKRWVSLRHNIYQTISTYQPLANLGVCLTISALPNLQKQHIRLLVALVGWVERIHRNTPINPNRSVLLTTYDIRWT